jgi:hypothetical protein
MAASASDLALLGPDYPRVFFFRSADSVPYRSGMTYERWSEEYGRLMGIMGKCLDEEVLGREKFNPEWFSRFKREHPKQAVLLHFNGNARDPRYATEKYFAGHWVYREATAIIADVPAEPGETEIRVADASDFRTGSGRYRSSNDDVALFRRDGRRGVTTGRTASRCSWCRWTSGRTRSACGAAAMARVRWRSSPARRAPPRT